MVVVLRLKKERAGSMLTREGLLIMRLRCEIPKE
jgi:hypothetical protein